VRESRFPVVDPAAMTDRQKEVADRISGGPRGGLRGPYLALITHPDLADVIQQMGEHLRFRSKLPAQLIELAVLVVARHWTCQFEWFAHERFAKAHTDLPEEIIRAIKAGRLPDVMTDEQRVVHDFVARTIKLGAPDDAVYGEAAELFGPDGVLDLLATCGYYCMIAMILNTTQIPLPDGETPPLRELP
jgi:4-carboxymuconolactone decarboxylase